MCNSMRTTKACWLTVWVLMCSGVTGEYDICAGTNIARALCKRLFPLRVQNPMDWIMCPKLVMNSTCSYVSHSSTLTFSGVYPCYENVSFKVACATVPPNTTQFSSTDNLEVRNTAIETLESKSFYSWTGISVLQISMNKKLRRIEPGAFENLINVWNMTISDNRNLGPLERDTFQGLINLRELRYSRNNVKKLNSVTVALSPLVLPNVTVLDFTGNNIISIGRDDFKPMKGSSLDTLVITLTKTEWIDKRAFDPLGSLVSLILSRNNLNCSALTKLVNHLIKNDVKLTHLSVGENILNLNPKSLLEAVAQNESGVKLLDLQGNHLGRLSPGFFPKMSNLEDLDLTNVMIDDVPDGVITHELLPKLRHLFLGENMFYSIEASMVTKTIRRLYIPYNYKAEPWNTNFEIKSSVLSKMPFLQLLDLTGNRINILKNTTFTYSKNLKVLLLGNAFLNEIEEGAFINNNKLFYLDLSQNIFPIVNSFTKEIFRGLDNLIALDLSNCKISQIDNEDVFFYLTKLQYLSLRMNSIHHISPRIFERMPNLGVIDLRFNILAPWTASIFSNNKQLNKTLLDFNHLDMITDTMVHDLLSSQTVTLYGNPITCDCRLINSFSSVLDKLDTSSLPFDDDVDVCANDKTMTLRAYLGMVNSAMCINTKWVTIIPLTLGCLLFIALIVYIIYYYYKYDIHFWWLKAKRKLGLLHYIGGSKSMESTQGYKYDAFVSYCIEDEKFVEKMVYILETYCSKFKLCFFERDFKVGDILTDRILECMECSSRTILVLTEAFAKSQWCCWEMYIAQNRSISLNRSDPNDPLILIKKSDVPESLMTPTLRYLMKTRVYLEWPDSPIKQKIFWEQLINSLGPGRIAVNS